MLVLLALLLLPMAGCNADKSLVEDESEFVPYWWRDDPYFKDKNIDEEATLALGLPDVVLGKSEDDEKNKMYRTFTEKLSELYGEKHILHALIYHRDEVLVKPGAESVVMMLSSPFSGHDLLTSPGRIGNIRAC